MKNSTLVERIKQLGFSEYEAKCYLALFERELLTVSEVSRLAGVPRPNAYEAMEKLMAKGLCVSIPGKMKRYAASDPWFLREKSLGTLNVFTESELDSLEKKRKEILERHRSFQENIEGIAGELEPLFIKSRTDGSPLDYIEILKDPFRIHRKVIQLCSEAKREMQVFTKPPYSFSTKEQQLEQLRPQLDALRRGVRIKTIYEAPSGDIERRSLIESARESFVSGEEAKAVDSLPIKLAIFDQRIVLFALVDPIIGKPSVTSLVADHQALAQSLVMLFDSFWAKAMDYITISNRKVYLNETGKKKSDV
jgi:sugar-specific transcriptional regulator TrmB